MITPDYIMTRAGAHTSTHAPTLRALFEESARIYPDLVIKKEVKTWLSARFINNLETEITQQKDELVRRSVIRQDWGRRGQPHGFVHHPFHDGTHIRANKGIFTVLRRNPGVLWIRLTGYCRPGAVPEGVQREIVLTVRLGNSALILDRAYGMEPVIIIDSTRVHFTYKRRDTWNMKAPTAPRACA